MRVGRVLLCVVATALGGGFSAARAEPTDEVAAHTWVTLRSPHVEVVTDAGRELGTRISRQLEQLHEAFAFAAPGFVVPMARVQVLVFRDHELFQAYSPRWRGMRDELGGYFLPGSDRRRMLFSDRPGRTQAVAQHEYTHALLEASLPELPLWLNEGLAEYWSTFQVNGTVATAGTPVRDHLDWLESNDLLPLDRLFKMTQASAEYHEGDRRGTFYAQCWALVHLLLSSEADMARLNRCLASFREGQPFDAAFAREFGPESSLRERLHAHLDQPRHRVREWSVMGADANRGPEAQATPPAAVLATLGNALLAHDPPQREFADDNLRRARRLDPRQPEALAGLGWLELMAGHSDSALALLERAVRTEPISVPAVRLAAAEWPPFATELGRGPARTRMVATLREALGRARASAPNDPELIALLARTWVVEPGDDAEPGYKLAQQAVVALPGRTDVRLDLLALAALTGRLAEARSLAERYFARNTRADAAAAVRNALFAGEMMEVNRLIKLEQFGPADSALRRARARIAGDAELEKEADEFLARLGQYRKDQAAVGAENVAVQHYNAGVQLANEKKPKQALEEFRRAEVAAASDSLKARARWMQMRMRTRLRGDEALALARQGKVSEAIQILEGLLKPGISADERRWIEQNLASMRAHQGR